MKNKLLLAIMLFFSCSAFCQKLEEKLIIMDGIDSFLQNSFRSCFDTAGNYYFETITNPQYDSYDLVTNTKKYNQVYWGYDLAMKKYKSVTANAFFADKTKKTIYYKNKNGTKVYGPVRGRIKNFYEYGKENIAIEFCARDTSFFYINNTLVNVCDTASQSWQCSFSNNNNAIFSFYWNGQFRLYLNNKLIDSSKEPFSDLSINDHKFYVYSKTKGNTYTICTPTKSFGPYKGTSGFNNLLHNDSYYFWGCDDTSCIVLVNGKVYGNIKAVNYLLKDMQTGTVTRKTNEQVFVEIPDNNNFLFCYNQYNNDSGFYINANGSIKSYHYNRLSYIFTNPEGEYAFFGTEVDSLGVDRTYKVVNNSRQLLLKNGDYITKGVQVSPDGQSFYYYESNDSVFVYQNDKLMYSPLPSEKFTKWDESNFPQSHREGNEFFQCFNIDTFTVIAYNNTLSKRLPLVNLDFNRMEPYKKGNIVAGDINDKGFFMIEYLAPKKYLLIINNSIYKELDGIDRIFGGQSYFEDNSLIFYGTKGSGFYEFRLNF